MNLNYYYRVSDHLEYPELVEHRGLGGSLRLCKGFKIRIREKRSIYFAGNRVTSSAMGREDPTTHLFSGKPSQNFGGGDDVREGGGVTTGREAAAEKKVFLPPPRRFPQSSILLLATENKSLLGPPFSWGPGGWLVGRKGEKEENYFPFLGWGKWRKKTPAQSAPLFLI